MATIKHIVTGAKIVRVNWPITAIAFAFKFLLAFLFVIPLQNLVSEAFGYRPAAELLLKEWNLTPLIDFVFSNLDALKQYGYFVVVGIILTLIIHLFLNGGFFRTLAVAQREEYRTFSAGGFFRRCGQYFWPFVKIAVISAIVYMAVAFLFVILSRFGLRLIINDFTPEPVKIFVALGRLMVLLLILLFVNMLMVYVRIAAVSDESRQILKALVAATEFLSGNLKNALVLYVGLLVGLAVLFGAYLLLQRGCDLLPTTLTTVKA